MQETDLHDSYRELTTLQVSRSNDLVYESLRKAILQGVFAPGQRLIEARLGERFGVSRGPVREAIRSLEREGLIQSSPRRGVFVASLGKTDIAEIYGLRLALECGAIRDACKHITEDDLVDMARLVREMEESSAAHALDLLAHEDVAFHRKICELSGNSRLLNTWLSVLGQIQLLSEQVITSLYADLAQIPQRHDLIFEALAARDQDAAEVTMRSHIDSVASRILETL